MSFKTTCPHCGIADKLYVTKITMVKSGKTLEINTLLLIDGFIFNPNDEDLKDDWSTENEEVTCRGCGNTISLDVLTN